MGDNSQGKFTFKGSVVKRDKLSGSCCRVFSLTTISKDFMSVYNAKKLLCKGAFSRLCGLLTAKEAT